MAPKSSMVPEASEVVVTAGPEVAHGTITVSSSRAVLGTNNTATDGSRGPAGLYQASNGQVPWGMRDIR